MLREYILKFINEIIKMFPIKKNRCLIYSSYGANYGCSPKYVSEYLVENNPEIEVVWAFNQPEKYDIRGVKKVKNMSLKYFYYLSTSKFIVTNFRTPVEFKKRDKQIYIQTWHSSLRLKMIEKDAEDTLPQNYIKQAKEDSKKLDYLVSGCKYSTEIFKKCFWYDGEILEIGTPRNDFLLTIKEKKIRDIKDNLDIGDEKILLYAPTFRKDNNLDVYNVDYERLLNGLEKKYNCKWKILLRLHPHLINIMPEIKLENVINVTRYDDIQELLAISDILISDYSSLMFDFTITKRPCFLYVPDLEEYQSKDRKLYFNVKELPFKIAKSNDELIDKIVNFSNEEYNKSLELFLNKIGSYENGKASQKIAELIKNKIEEER